MDAPGKTSVLCFPNPKCLGRSYYLKRPRPAICCNSCYAIIKHVCQPLTHWLVSPSYLEENRQLIAFVGYLPQLNDDLPILLQTLSLPTKWVLPKDDFAAHRMPAGMQTGLSDQALANIQGWYRGDYAILAWCIRFRKATGL